MLLVALSACPAKDAARKTVDLGEFRAQIEQLAAYLDGAAYAAEISWSEHVVLAYQVALGREPTLLEYKLIEALEDHHGMARSEVLAIALRGEGDVQAWEALAIKADANRFVPTESVRSAAQRLESAPDSLLRETLQTARMAAGMLPSALAPPAASRRKQQAGVAYNTYFGFLHAHSHLSLDATGDVDEAYRYAREEGGLDFFALTDHAEFLAIWPWDRKWEVLVAAADAAYAPGAFTTFYGFEWSNPFLGHVSVINTPGFTDTIETFPLADFYAWLAQYPDAFGHFNHPGDFDYLGMEFYHFDPYPEIFEQLGGIETWTGRHGFGRYHYVDAWHGAPSYLDAANRRGWRVGALGSGDNHRGEWGTSTPFRTAVLALENTREALLEAYRARRFYATEDKDLFLDFRCQGHPMGARLTHEARDFVVQVSDASGDHFREARLYRNGDLIATAALSGSEATAYFSDPDRGGNDYYYVIVTQHDDQDGDGRGDEALSSPIWFGEIPPSSVGCAAAALEQASRPAAGLPILVSVLVLMLAVPLRQST